MKIAHVISYFQPRLGYQEYYLAKKQQEMGHEVRVFTSDRMSENTGKVLGGRYLGSGRFYEEGVMVIRLPCIFEYANNVLMWGLIKELKEFRPDIVHAHEGMTSFSSFTSLILKDLLKYKVIVDCHMDYSLQSKTKIRRLLLHLLSKNIICRYSLKKADGYIAIAESSRKWLSIEFGIDYGKIEFIPLGAETRLFFQDVFERNRQRERLDIKENEILVIYAGKLVPAKEIRVLLLATAPLIHKYGNPQIILVGNGSRDYLIKLKQLVCKLGIDNNVRFFNFISRKTLPTLYNAADIGVWPGRSSITIVEAMATGLPIVIAQSDRTSHYLKYNNGFSFRRGDVEGLRSVLETLLLNESLRKSMGARGRKLVERDLNWSKIAKQTLELYHRILTQHNP